MHFTTLNTGFKDHGVTRVVEYENFATFLLREGPCHCDVTYMDQGAQVTVLLNYGKVISVITEPTPNIFGYPMISMT